jgi:Protein of unknown function (DUF3048) N-terminal domain/Protein of unknown function (DUF3048) C-terminal domain
MVDDIRPAKPAPSGQDKPERPQTAKAETFKTPDEVAAADDIGDPALAARVDLPEAAPSKTGRLHNWRGKLDLHWPPGRKEYITAGVVVLLLAVGLFFGLHHSKPKPVAKVAVVKVAPKPTTVASTLSGLQVDPKLNKLPVTGVMIENSTDARPQSGLGQAMVVFEAVAEGGVTRFLALFQDTSPGSVGPVRSARPYYIQWALGFNAGYAHVGGSPDGLADIKAWGVRDLDQFANSGAYDRVASRAAPHNVYTSIARLNQLETSKGYTTSTFTGFVRKKEAPAKTPTARSINLTLSGPVYNAHYDYNAATNSYNRSEGGAPQVDANSNTQISPKVVVAMVVPMSQGALDASGAYYSNYNVIGSGTAYIFQDGIVTTGQWTKSDNTTQITFTDAAGKPLGLNPGQTWLTAVTDTSKVSSAP